MYHVTLISAGKVVEEFDCNEALMKELKVYEELGFEVTTKKIS